MVHTTALGKMVHTTALGKMAHTTLGKMVHTTIVGQVASMEVCFNVFITKQLIFHYLDPWEDDVEPSNPYRSTLYGTGCACVYLLINTHAGCCEAIATRLFAGWSDVAMGL